MNDQVNVENTEQLDVQLEGEAQKAPATVEQSQKPKEDAEEKRPF
ncbi:MAG TPA: hypothetical protein VFV08_11200 [Puia sp.]|nr:hypothetical protein [Puia sp.]